MEPTATIAFLGKSLVEDRAPRAKKHYLSAHTHPPSVSVTIARTLRSVAVAQEKLPKQAPLAVQSKREGEALAEPCAIEGYLLIAVRSATSLCQSTASQTIAVPSRLEERASRPSGEKATAVTSC